MADLIDRTALLEDVAGLVFIGRPGDAGMQNVSKIIDRIKAAPAVETIELNLLLRQLYKERTRLYRDDEAFEKRRAGYESSSFIAGFVYALERMVGWATSLEVERRTNATD